MTAVRGQRIPAPAPPPAKSAGPARLSAAARRAARAGDRAWWAAFGVVARYPKTAAAVATLVTATTPVTVGDVTGVVVGGCAASALISVADSSGRGTNPLAILPRLSTFRRRRARVRRRWVTVMHDCGLEAAAVYAGGPKRRPRLGRITETPHGVRVRAYGAGVSAGPGDFAAKAGKLRHGFGCTSVEVSTHRRAIILDLLWGDPLSKPVPAISLPRPARPGHVVVGVDGHGQPVEKDLRLTNLVVGAPGAGKSTEIWTMLAGLQRAGIPHRVRVFDPKGGMELGLLRGRCHRYVSDPSSWDTFVSDALHDLAARQERMRTVGLTEHTPSIDEPLDVMVVDELVTAIAMGGAGSKVKVGNKTITAEKAFLVLLSQGRAAGFTCYCGTQIVEKDILGAMRGLFAYVSVLRVGPTETTAVDMVLGSGAHKLYPAHELEPGKATAGIGWLRTDGGVTRYRAGYTTAGQRRAIAARMGGAR